jgi:hypothetical protein
LTAFVVVETWNLKPDKLEDFESFFQRWKNLVNERPDLFEEIRSWNSYRLVKGPEHSGMSLWEFDSVEDREKFRKKLRSDPELIELVSELGDYFDPDNHQEDMWRPVLKLK